MSAQATLRQRFLRAAGEIRQVYEETSETIGYDGRERVREAYKTLAELGTYVPDTEPGWLPYGDMPEKDIAAAVRQAEKGLASPAVTLQLVRQVRKLRQELTALGGPHGVTEADIRSMIAQGFSTAFRKAAHSMEAAIAWKAIRDLDPEEWRSVLDFTVGPVIAALREAEVKAAGAVQDTPWPANDPELVTALMKWAMAHGAIITRKWFGLSPAPVENKEQEQETS